MPRRPVVTAAALLCLLGSCVVLVVLASDDGRADVLLYWYLALTFAFGCVLPFRSASTSDDPHDLDRDWAVVARASGAGLAIQVVLALALTPLALTGGGWGWRWLLLSLLLVVVGGLFALLLAPLAYVLVFVALVSLLTQTGAALRGEVWPQVRVIGSLMMLALATALVLVGSATGHDPRSIGGRGGQTGRVWHTTSIVIGLTDPDPGALPWALTVVRVAYVVILLGMIGLFVALTMSVVRPRPSRGRYAR